MAAELERLQPDIILVGLGSPKQEFVIRALRPRLPNAWRVGVGISFSFAAGLIARAPVVLRTFGLEWVHRLAMEPRRLGRRYLIEGIPFAGRLFRAAVSERLQRQRRGTSTDIDQIF
jgi:N-acetylglucosaminyldiphosphoundecaprenol N-acetyl-beta-D-mannosaminyltransferase